MKITVLGAGSNTLLETCVRVVLKLGRNFSYTKIIDNNIIDGAATLDRKVASFAKDNNLGNLEFLSRHQINRWSHYDEQRLL